MKKGIPVLVGLVIVAGLVSARGWVNAAPSQQAGSGPLDVVINEVAWGGTAASPADEWIELYNNTGNAIDLSGWTLTAADGTPGITLKNGKTIPAHGYFLLERTDDNAVSDVAADQIYTGALGNSGEKLELRDDAGTLIDTANGDGGGWPAGTGSPDYRSMERITPSASDADSNWATNDGVTRNGLDADGNPINGTPKAPNSVTGPPTAITLTSFTAEASAGRVTLAWETGTELDNAGFNLYRATAEDGPYTRINDALIAAEGDPVSGARYSFLDTPGYGTFYYRLEDVDYYGVSTPHGPVAVTVTRPFRRPPHRPFAPH